MKKRTYIYILLAILCVIALSAQAAIIPLGSEGDFTDEKKSESFVEMSETGNLSSLGAMKMMTKSKDCNLCSPLSSNSTCPEDSKCTTCDGNAGCNNGESGCQDNYKKDGAGNCVPKDCTEINTNYQEASNGCPAIAGLPTTCYNKNLTSGCKNPTNIKECLEECKNCSGEDGCLDWECELDEDKTSTGCEKPQCSNSNYSENTTAETCAKKGDGWKLVTDRFNCGSCAEKTCGDYNSNYSDTYTSYACQYNRLSGSKYKTCYHKTWKSNCISKSDIPANAIGTGTCYNCSGTKGHTGWYCDTSKGYEKSGNTCVKKQKECHEYTDPDGNNYTKVDYVRYLSNGNACSDDNYVSCASTYSYEKERCTDVHAFSPFNYELSETHEDIIRKSCNMYDRFFSIYYKGGEGWIECHSKPTLSEYRNQTGQSCPGKYICRGCDGVERCLKCDPKIYPYEKKSYYATCSGYCAGRYRDCSCGDRDDYFFVATNSHTTGEYGAYCCNKDMYKYNTQQECLNAASGRQCNWCGDKWAIR